MTDGKENLKVYRSMAIVKQRKPHSALSALERIDIDKDREYLSDIIRVKAKRYAVMTKE